MSPANKWKVYFRHQTQKSATDDHTSQGQEIRTKIDHGDTRPHPKNAELKGIL